jgi:hypothetical protein
LAVKLRSLGLSPNVVTEESIVKPVKSGNISFTSVRTYPLKEAELKRENVTLSTHLTR